MTSTMHHFSSFVRCAARHSRLARHTLAGISLSCAALQSWALPLGVSCKVTTPAPKTPIEQAADSAIWGHWETFEERLVQLDGEPQPEQSPSYHLLMKRPGMPATDKPLVVFLHGFPEFSWSWETWLKLIGEKHDTIAIDLKGYGSSSKPVPLAPYQLLRLANELDHVVQCLGYKSVIPVGHDWGGGLAWAYALFHPEHLKALVVLSTPHPYTYYRELADPTSEQRQRSHYIELIRENTLQSMVEFFSMLPPDATSALFGPFYKGGRLNRLLAANMDTPDKWQRMFSYYRVMDYPPSPLLYPKQPSALSKLIFSVRVPTLAYWGTADAFFSPKSWEGVDQFVPKLDLRAIDGAGHFINHDRPELPGEVLQFIDTQSLR